jgi:hypothetical protein
MSAADALRAAHAAGIAVTLDGDGILLEADTEPPRALLETLERNKLAIVDSRSRDRTDGALPIGAPTSTRACG